MTKEEFFKLKRGDIIRHKVTGTSYVVHDAKFSRVIAVRTIEAENPDEWEVHKEPPLRADQGTLGEMTS